MIIFNGFICGVKYLVDLLNIDQLQTEHERRYREDIWKITSCKRGKSNT